MEHCCFFLLIAITVLAMSLTALPLIMVWFFGYFLISLTGGILLSSMSHCVFWYPASVSICDQTNICHSQQVRCLRHLYLNNGHLCVYSMNGHPDLSLHSNCLKNIFSVYDFNTSNHQLAWHDCKFWEFSVTLLQASVIIYHEKI